MTLRPGDRVQWDDYVGVLEEGDEWIGTVVGVIPGAIQIHWDYTDEPERVWYLPEQVRKLNSIVIAEVE